MNPRQFDKTVIKIHYMHPGPIGRGLSLPSNLFDLDCLYTSLISSEEELGTQSLLLLSPGRILWGRFEMIESVVTGADC